MAYTTYDEDHGVLKSVWSTMTWTFRALGQALAINATVEARLSEVNRLRELSDADLDRLGVPRDRIVHHVFHDIDMI